MKINDFENPFNRTEPKKYKISTTTKNGLNINPRTEEERDYHSFYSNLILLKNIILYCNSLNNLEDNKNDVKYMDKHFKYEYNIKNLISGRFKSIKDDIENLSEIFSNTILTFKNGEHENKVIVDNITFKRTKDNKISIYLKSLCEYDLLKFIKVDEDYSIDLEYDEFTMILKKVNENSKMKKQLKNFKKDSNWKLISVYDNTDDNHAYNIFQNQKTGEIIKENVWNDKGILHITLNDKITKINK